MYDILGPVNMQWELPAFTASVYTLAPSQPKPEYSDTFTTCVQEVDHEAHDAHEQSAER